MQLKRELTTYLLLLGAFFVIATPILLGDAYNLIAATSKAQHWPSTNGSINHVEIIGPTAFERGHTTFGVKVFFDYTVNGHSYSNVQGTFGDLKPTPMSINIGSVSAENKDELVAKYPKGKSVSIYYNPEAPGESMLDRDITLGGLTSVYFFLGLDVIVLTFAILSIKKGTRRVGAVRVQS